MIYLDYSATTKVDKKVLERFNFIEENFYANPNSVHKEGLKAKKIIDEAIKKITDYFNIKTEELIFTSGSSESNNFAIKSLALNTKKKHIITTSLEHSSVLAPLGYLQSHGYKISFVKLTKEGKVDLEDLKQLITEDTFLVSISAVNSELGITQPIEAIGKLLKEYQNITFHSDITQAVGKIKIDLTNVDLASFSAHKIYSFKGIGCLIKKENIKLTPLIHGGKSTSINRSGTPATSLIDSIATAIDLVNENSLEKYNYVKELNLYLRNALKDYPNITINSPSDAIPHILNISIKNLTSDEIFDYFSENDIMLSTKSACSSNTKLSKAVLDYTKDESLAASCIRISLSYKTTKKELEEFLKTLKTLVGEV